MIPFTKMHGLGNDFVVLDAFAEPALALRADLPELAKVMTDRRLGVGADGLLLLTPPDPAPDAPADFRMRIVNADGSEPEMCGNGLRCAAKYLLERGHVVLDEQGQVRCRTPAGVLPIHARFDGELRVHEVTVDMGAARLTRAAVPLNESALGPVVREHPSGAIERRIGDLVGVVVSVGNPHFVCFLDRPVEEIDLDAVGPAHERHPAFPDRINVQLVNVLDPGHARVRTWERGAGATQACGTGACAVLGAGVATGRLDAEARIDLPGGSLRVRTDPSTARIFMTGPAVETFAGSWPQPGPDAIDMPLLETERLTLRPYLAEDLPEIVRVMSDPKISECTLTSPHPYPLNEAVKFFRRMSDSRRAGTGFVYAMIRKSDGRYLGGLGLRIDRANDGAELGYIVDMEVRGQGFAPEASERVVRFGFEQLGLRRVFAQWFVWNEPSRRVLEKIGMKFEGRLRVAVKKKERGPSDLEVWSILRDEWEARCRDR